MARTRAKSAGGGTSIVTGTYTGDGATTQAIVGVGFIPRAVQIYVQSDVAQPLGYPMGWKTNQDGVNAFLPHYETGNVYEADHIVSLDVDGFTVGDGTATVWGNVLNVLGRVYAYACWGT